MNDCLFCKIITREIPSEKVYEDAQYFAFLDANPVNIGHTLLVPKAHHANLYETPDAILAGFAPILKKLAIAVKEAVHCDGINIAMNNDAPAGQVIFHTHVHIIPRFANDGFTHWKGVHKYEGGEMMHVGGTIRDELE